MSVQAKDKQKNKQKTKTNKQTNKKPAYYLGPAVLNDQS